MKLSNFSKTSRSWLCRFIRKVFVFKFWFCEMPVSTIECPHQEETANYVPSIGVLCIDLANSLAQNYGYKWHSYLASAYVKQLEAAGALVVPIWIGRDRSYYENMMSQLNGILLPGGAVFLDNADLQNKPGLTNDCVQSAYYIYDLAIELNESGNYFPLWGTCLGFQLIMIRAAKTPDVRIDCEIMHKALPLQLTEDWRESVLLKQLPEPMAQEMGQAHFACHLHRYCITKGNLKKFKLLADWHILATQSDKSGQEFITLIEHRRWPIFGCQFHPERAAYGQLYAAPDPWSISHSRSCIELALWPISNFVEACRRNSHRFASTETKSRHLIWNWQPVFCGHLKDSQWLQCYLFEKDEQYPPEERFVSD